MPNSQVNKSKSAIKNLTLNLPWNLIGSSNEKTNFANKLLLTNIQVSKMYKAFANGSTANIKFSKSRLSKIIQSGGFIFGPPNIIHSSIPSDLFIALIKRLYSLSKSIAKESK